MTPISKRQHWLYLLTALVLLMQSFAIWHDASHPFHTVTEQCHQYEAISHTPTADLASSLLPLFSVQNSTVEPDLFITLTSKLVRDNHPIRAPPLFS